MKINCDVVKDLLPQYADGTLKEDTAEMVKAHLDECGECREYYDEIIRINEELDRGEAAAPYADDIGALNGIKKRLRHRRLLTVIITIAAVFVLLIGAYIYADMHYTYIPYEESGIVVRNNEIRTSSNYAMLQAFYAEIDGENVEFIFLLSNPISRSSGLKGEITIMDMDDEISYSQTEDDDVTVVITDKVYYLPESAISKLPFLFHKDYMHDLLEDPDFWKKLEENIDQYVLVWSRMG